MYPYASAYCQYRIDFRSVKLSFRYENKWDNVLKSILKLNKTKGKKISNKYLEPSIECEMNENVSCAQIRRRLGFIYGIDYNYIEIWKPGPNDSFIFDTAHRGSWRDSIKSLLGSPARTFTLSLKWEIVGYSTDTYDNMIAAELDAIEPSVETQITTCKSYSNEYSISDVYHDNQNYTNTSLTPKTVVLDNNHNNNNINNGYSTDQAMYRVLLVPPNIDIDNDNNNEKNGEKKYIDVIYKKRFIVSSFIKHILLIINQQPIISDEFKDVFGNMSSFFGGEDRNTDNKINNQFVLSKDTKKHQRILFGHETWQFPKENSICEVEKNTFCLQMLQNEDEFHASFQSGNIQINDEEERKPLIIKFWRSKKDKIDNNTNPRKRRRRNSDNKNNESDKYEICGTVLRLKVAAKDNLKDIIQNKLKDLSTKQKLTFYLNGNTDSNELGKKIEENHYQYCFPFTILLCNDGAACINVLYHK